MRFTRVILGLLVALMLVAPAQQAMAQAVDRGLLEGIVRDANGKGLADAIVTITGPQGVRTALTGKDGSYQFLDLLPGDYTVKAEKEGMSTLVQTDVVVVLGKRTQLPFTLTEGVVETVTVTSEAPLVDMKSSGASAVISTEQLVQHIPLGRGFATMFTLSPGVTSGLASGAGNYSISGSSGLENSYLIDGVNITNSGYGGIGSYNRVFGSLGSGVTNDFIEQVEVKEGGFEAEFGQATGGVLNAIVKSGTNTLSGNVTVYTSPNSFEATRKEWKLNPDSITTVETDAIDAAFDLGGPIVKDRLFWYAAYNPVQTETTFKRLVEDPSVLLDANGNLIDPNQSTGGRTETRKRTNDNYAGKVSWFLTPNHRIELTAFGDPSEGDFGPQRSTSLRRIGEDGYSKLDYGGNNYSGKYFGAMTSNLFVDAMYARHESELTETGASMYSIFDINANITRGGLGFTPQTDETVDQYSLKVTYVWNNHEFKVGYQKDEIDYFEAGRQSGPEFNVQLPVGAMQTYDPDGVANSGDEFTDWAWDGTTFPFSSTTGAFLYLNDQGTPSTADDTYVVQRSRFSPVAVQTKNEETNYFVQWTYNPIPELTLKVGARHTEEYVAGGSPFTMPFSVVRPSSAVGAIGGARNRFVDPTAPREFDPTSTTFPTEWAPRIGVTWDINGDGKNKVYANYGVYVQRLTQDLAYRAFSNEVDLRMGFEDAMLTTPLLTASCATTNIVGGSVVNGNCQAIVGATGLGGPSVLYEGTELPKTSEYLLGFSRELTSTMALDARWIHREIDTVIEDFAETPQESIDNLLWGTGVGFDFDPYPGYAVASFGNYILANPGENTAQAVQDLAAQGLVEQANADGWADGTIPDFPKPTRDYDALELILNKRFSDNWVLWASYRYAELRGNYEGLLRNDNGQDDPNITSLYDFPNTPLMRGQFIEGVLNTDVAHNLKAYGSYNFHNGLTLGGGMSWATGTPRFQQLVHPNDLYQLPGNGEVPGIDPVYGSWHERLDLNGDPVGLDGVAGTADDTDLFLLLSHGIGAAPSEIATGALDGNGNLIFTDYATPDPIADGVVDELVPGIFENQFLYSYTPIQRDNNGRTPDRVSLDLHLGYTFDLGGKAGQIKLMADVFNVFNSQNVLSFDDVLELQQGIANPNFSRPGGNIYPYQGPRTFRVGARWSF